MSVRHAVGPAKPGYPRTRLSAEATRARTRVLERAYPLAKQLAELLELEAIEPLATQAKRIRQAIGMVISSPPYVGNSHIVVDEESVEPFNAIRKEGGPS